MNSKRHFKKNLGHVVQILVCRKRDSKSLLMSDVGRNMEKNEREIRC